MRIVSQHTASISTGMLILEICVSNKWSCIVLLEVQYLEVTHFNV